MKMKQRTTEWIENVSIKYHERQFKAPYRSTVAFCDWLEEIGYIQRSSQLNILDIGSGGGANIFYMGKRYPNSQFTGIDINSNLVANGNIFFQKNGIDNCRLMQGDIYDLSDKFVAKSDAILSFQTLSWLPEFKKPIASLSKLKAKWIALSSLFYDGPLSCTIEVQNYDVDLNTCDESFNNVYSLPIIKDYFNKNGYSNFRYKPFEIDIDLPRPTEKGSGTFTEQLTNGHRLQISGPLLMPWYFVVAKATISS